MSAKTFLPRRPDLERALLAGAFVALAHAWWRLLGDHAPGWPAWPSLLLAAVAAAVAITIASSARRGAVAVACASAAVAVPLVDLLLRAIELRVEAVPGIGAIAGAVLAAGGEAVATADGRLHFAAHEGAVAFLGGFDQLALRPAAGVVVAFLLAIGQLDRAPRLARAACFLAIAAVAIVARALLLFLLFADADGALVPSQPPNLLLFTHEATVLPLLALLAAAGAASLLLDGGFVTGTWRGALARAAAAAAIGVALGVLAARSPAGPAKSGRVLIDDAHSGHWEAAARTLDPTYYGDFSTYSMSSLAEWLGRRFAVRVNAARALDDELLAATDVLVLKTPCRPYSEAEIAAVHRFVERGGGLFLISDHTNLLGMSSHLNAIGARYALRFRADSVSTSDGGFNRFRAGWLTPAPARRLDEFLLMTSCSIEVGARARPLLVARDGVREPADYGRSSYFSGIGADPAFAAGPLVLLAGAEHGRGRVVAFTDSTVLSSFDLFKFDHDTLVLDVVTWLNHEAGAAGTATWLRCAAGIALLGLLLGVVRAGARGGAGLALGLTAAALGGIAGAGIGMAADARAIEPPPERERSRVVSFLWEGGTAAFPPVLGGLGELSLDVVYDTLFVVPQRLGLRPRVAHSYGEALSGADALVVIDPWAEPPAEFVEQLGRWVEEGGQLFVLLRSAPVAEEKAAAYLAPFGVTIDAHAGPPPHRHVAGAEPLSLPASELQAYACDAGRGGVTVVLGSEHLSRNGLGHCFDIPDSTEHPRLDSLYALLSNRAQLEPVSRLTYSILE